MAKRLDAEVGEKHSCDHQNYGEFKYKWIFLQRVKKENGYAFVGVEKLLWGTFLPCLFFGESKYLPPIVGTLSTMPVNKSNLGIQDLVTSSNDKYLSLICTSRDLIGSLAGESEFSTTYNLQAVKEERCDGKKTWDDVNNTKLDVISKNFPTLERRPFLRAKYMGSFLTVWGTIVIDTVLTATEICDFLCARYDFNPPNLQKM